MMNLSLTLSAVMQLGEMANSPSFPFAILLST